MGSRNSRERGCEYGRQQRSVSLSEQYEFVYSAVGVHPDEVGELREEDMEWMREQLQKPKGRGGRRDRA